MLIYADNKFYFDDYILNKSAVLNTKNFSYYAREASVYIDRYTFGQVTEPVPEPVKMCCCELAERIYSYYQQKDNQGVASESVGGWSKSYESSEVQEKAFSRDIKNIIYKWLSNTNLLYRGCRNAKKR